MENTKNLEIVEPRKNNLREKCLDFQVELSRRIQSINPNNLEDFYKIKELYNQCESKFATL